MNGQMGPSVRAPTSMGRHPSREQLIDYLMLKVSQPQAPPRYPHDTRQQEVKNAPVFLCTRPDVDARDQPVCLFPGRSADIHLQQHIAIKL